MKPFLNFGEQVQRNLVALISVFIAVSSLSYNTWRNEKSEYNRNQRWASFEVLMHLGELRETTFHLHWDTATVEESALRSGWVMVLTIKDLSELLEAPIPAAAESLRSTWEGHSTGLGHPDQDGSKASGKAILTEIDDMRDITLKMLRELD
jgi:predicted DNA-binding protein with PD1-like motif